MTEEWRAGDPTDRTGGLAWWMRHGDRFLLPIAGAVAVTLGISPLIGLRTAWAPFTPLVLVILGLSLLLSALARSTADSPRVTERTVAVLPDRSEISIDHSVRTRRGVPPELPARPREVNASEKAGPPRRAAPGDRLWGSWVAPVRKLPVPLVGPVPETAYVPHRPGAPSLYEEGELVVVQSPSSEDRRSERYVAPLDEGEFSSFPALVSSYALEPEALAAVRVQDLEGESTRMGVPSSFGALAREPSARARETTPSQVRDTAPAEHNPARPERRQPGPLRLPRCAGCRQEVTDSGSPNRCVACLRRLCADCLDRVHRTREGPWCPHCAGVEHQDGLSREVARRSASTLDDSSTPVARFARPSI